MIKPTLDRVGFIIYTGSLGFQELVRWLNYGTFDKRFSEEGKCGCRAVSVTANFL